MALLGCEEQEALAREFARVDDGLNGFALVEGKQVDNWHALCGSLALGNVECTQAIDAPAVGEEQQIRVACCEDDMANDVVCLHLCATDTAATAAFGAERVGADGLHVLGFGHHDDQLFVVDQILNA